MELKVERSVTTDREEHGTRTTETKTSYKNTFDSRKSPAAPENNCKIVSTEANRLQTCILDSRAELVLILTLNLLEEQLEYRTEAERKNIRIKLTSLYNKDGESTQFNEFVTVLFALFSLGKDCNCRE
jgi:hypothetical protein